MKGNPSFSTPSNDHTEPVPGMNGECDFGATFGSRTVTLELVSPRTTDKATTRRDLLASFPLREVEITFEGFIHKVVLESQITFKDYPHHLEASVPLRMCNPYVYGTLRELTESGTAQNSGNTDSYPLIEIYGMVTDPSISVGSTTMTWNGTLGAGETLYIDCQKKTVRHESDNAMGGFSGSFGSIPSGGTSVYSTCSFKVTWRDTYI